MIFLVQDFIDFAGTQIDGGTCDEDKQIAVLNECVMHLLQAADWKLTVRKAQITTCNGWFSCPREFEKVLAVTNDSRPVDIHSKWWQFLEGGPGRIDDLADVWAGDLVDQGSYPTFADIKPDKERYLIAFSTESADTSKVLTVKGHGTYNRELMTNGVPGISVPINQWTGGTEGTIANITTESKTTDTVKRVTGVTKPETAGYVTLYAYDPDYDIDEDEPMLIQLGIYHPDETQPSYRRYKIMHSHCCGDPLVVLAKLAYVPAKRLTDVLLIQNLPALKFMVQAINKYNTDDVNAGNALEVMALAKLSQQVNEYEHQDNTITIQGSYNNGEVPNIR